MAYLDARYAQHEQIAAADLKPGDKVMLPGTAMVGWRAFRHDCYKEYTVIRITPKLTKIYLTDGTGEIDINPSKMLMFKPSPAINYQNLIATSAITCSRIMALLGNQNLYIHNLSDEDIIELHRNLTNVKALLDKVSSKT